MASGTITIQPVTAPLRGEITVPGDKSISHRSIMFGALAEGDTRIRGFLRGADCLSTISCFRQLGIQIDENTDEIIVHGNGLDGLHEPAAILDAGNSGTTIRLMSGILSGQPFSSVITGDESIQKRPMKRVIEPLTMMGASVSGCNGSHCAPLSISGVPDPDHPLTGITYFSPVASAQVKSCVLLAGLYADSDTTVIEPALSRDHTERMLTGFGAHIRYGSDTEPDPSRPRQSHSATISPHPVLHGMDIDVPGDISSAAYFIAAGLIIPESEVLIRNVGINPTRDGILRVARDMGGDVSLLNCRETGGEPVADILVRSSHLKGTRVAGPLIPTLIDELPVIAVMAACAEGTTVIADAAELKVKESDRILTVSESLTAMGIDVTPADDGMIIAGRGACSPVLRGACINSHADHRIAMSFAIASLAADSETKIAGAECVRISYPRFFEQLQTLIR